PRHAVPFAITALGGEGSSVANGTLTVTVTRPGEVEEPPEFVSRMVRLSLVKPSTEVSVPLTTMMRQEDPEKQMTTTVLAGCVSPCKEPMEMRFERFDSDDAY